VNSVSTDQDVAMCLDRCSVGAARELRGDAERILLERDEMMPGADSLGTKPRPDSLEQND
jgi:hypothetical protein